MTAATARERVRVREVFGLSPLGPALRQCWAAIAGDPHAPPSQWGISSLRIFKPLRISFPTWLGRVRRDRRVPVYLLTNRNQAPDHRSAGYSVRVTYARDFRGGRLTYDGHLGTDFAVPVGTKIVAAAPGVVRAVRNDMQRGGLKVCVDHGEGLLTLANHLSRALVRPGQRVARGEPIALSGMSSVDGVLFFPWLAPHLHLTVVLAGEATDPFAAPGERSLWRTGDNEPLPHAGASGGDLEPTRWDMAAVDASIAACRDEALRARLARVADPEQRAAEVAIERVLRSAAFARFPRLTARDYPRRPRLDLPFAAADFRGIVMGDALDARGPAALRWSPPARGSGRPRA